MFFRVAKLKMYTNKKLIDSTIKKTVTFSYHSQNIVRDIRLSTLINNKGNKITEL